MTDAHLSSDPLVDPLVDRGLRVGDPDGFGRYGILQQGPDGRLLCSDCGGTFAHLGLHAARAHGCSAAYRLRHGLGRTRGLVSADIRARQVHNAATSQTTQDALARTRDPVRAGRARIERGLPLSPAAAADRDQRFAGPKPARRTGRVTTCDGCGVQFCALIGSARRRFCSRACASRTTRARARTTAARDRASSPGTDTSPSARAVTKNPMTV